MMSKAQITYQAEAGRTTYTYRQRVALIAPRVWLWCAFGGVALGIAGATANAVFDLATDVSFRAALVGLSLAGTLVLYVLARLSTRTGVALRVAFDVLAGTLDVYRRQPHPTTERYTLTEIAEFRATDQQTPWQHTCVLTMHTTTQRQIPLVAVDRSCIPQTGLGELAARLNMALDAALNDMRAVPPRPEQPPYVPPSAQHPAMPPARVTRHPLEHPARPPASPPRHIKPEFPHDDHDEHAEDEDEHP